MEYETIFNNLIEACKYFYDHLFDNQKISIELNINNVLLGVNIYKLPQRTFITNSNNFIKNIVLPFCTNNDCDTQIVLTSDLEIVYNATFTPPYRCKGFIIYDAGTLENRGIISMTARGAHAAGKDIYLYDNQYVPAIGASGGASVSGSLTSQSMIYGKAGANGSGRQTGGGGAGSAGKPYNPYYSLYFTTGRGGNGTSFSGGAGAGQHIQHKHVTDNDTFILNPNGSNDGGSGGHGFMNWDYAYEDYGCPGGVGNPPGRYTRWTRGSFTRELEPNGNHGQASGTGGLLIIFANKLKNNGLISSNGVASLHDGTGSSGGGSINIFCNELISKGDITSIGGQGGIHGGNGTISIDYIPSSYFPYKNMEPRNNSDIYKNIYMNEVLFDVNQFFGEL